MSKRHFIHLQREPSGEEHTYGVLTFYNLSCDTIEDQYQKMKVDGETRIPAGTYQIKLRDAGGMNQRYKDKFSFHKGMLELQDVPNFTYVYIHIGNTDDDTLGCILVGDGRSVINGDKAVINSTSTYTELYSKIIKYLDQGDEVFITIRDGDDNG